MVQDRFRQKNILRDKAQVAIEMTLGLIACFILFLCTIQLFIWINRVIVERDRSYEDTRINAGGYPTGIGSYPTADYFPGAPFQDDNPNSETWTPPEFIPD